MSNSLSDDEGVKKGILALVAIVTTEKMACLIKYSPSKQQWTIETAGKRFKGVFRKGLFPALKEAVSFIVNNYEKYKALRSEIKQVNVSDMPPPLMKMVRFKKETNEQ